MLFVASEKREFSRSQAKGFKTLSLKSEDFENGSTVNFSFDGDVIKGNLAEIQETEASASEYSFIVKEFGVFSDYPSRLEVMFLDDYMLVTLIEGAILINLGGEILTATNGIDDSTLPKPTLNKIYWVKPDNLRTYARIWLGELKDFTDDYLISFIAKYSGGSDRYGHANGINVSLAGDLIDISNGAVTKYKNFLERQKVTQASKDFIKSVLAPVSSSEDDFVYNEDDYDDDENYDDEDEDYDDDDFI